MDAKTMKDDLAFDVAAIALCVIGVGLIATLIFGQPTTGANGGRRSAVAAAAESRTPPQVSSLRRFSAAHP
jgi:hypothetical protein